MGVYEGPCATKAVDAFAAWLGRETVWAVDNVGSESWNNVADPVWWLANWGAWEKAKAGRRLVLGIPILPGPRDLTGPTRGDLDVGRPVSLERGAEGAYDAHYARLARGLVAHGLGDAVLRLGWEFNGDWYAWAAKGRAEAFAGYWRRIVRTMRAAPGTERLRFCWNPTVGDVAMPAETAWPGDDVVDSIGLDVYDVSWVPDTYPWPATATPADVEARRATAWERWTQKSSRGLEHWVRFATRHGKPLALPEWGVAEGPDAHGGGDDVAFVERIRAFVTDPANRVEFHACFDADAGDGRHRISPGSPTEPATAFPRAAVRLRELFRAR